MADVQFFGIGATGFPDPNVQILTGNRPSDADVKFFGTNAGPSPTGALAKESELVENGPQAEFTTIEFFEGRDPVPASLQPNDNDLVFMVYGGPTQGARAIVAMTIPAVVPLGDGTIHIPPPVTNDLRLYVGPNAPSGLVGKVVTFIQPTGATTYANIRGATGLIQIISTPTGVFDTDQVPTALGVGIVFQNAISPQPTNGDRFVISSDDRALRRTPVIEIILE